MQDYYPELYILKSWYMMQVSYTSIIYKELKLNLHSTSDVVNIYIHIRIDVQMKELKYLKIGLYPLR